MNNELNFIRECGVFFVATVKGTKPQARPFGAIMQIDDDLYISTGKTKDVFKQIVNNPSIQIVALKQGTRNWIRISGKTIIVEDIELKKKMIEENPVLEKRYNGAEDENFALIKITNCSYEIFES